MLRQCIRSGRPTIAPGALGTACRAPTDPIAPVRIYLRAGMVLDEPGNLDFLWFSWRLRRHENHNLIITAKGDGSREIPGRADRICMRRALEAASLPWQ